MDVFDRAGPIENRSSIAEGWPSFEGDLTTPDNPSDTGPTDFMRFHPLDTVYTVSQSLLDRTAELWGLVEVLPLRCRTGDYAAVHVKRQRDAIDLEASTFRTWNEFLQGVPNFIVAEFNTDGLDEVDIFRASGTRPTYCTEAFVNKLRSAGATGWEAKQVYPPTPEQLEAEERLRTEKSNGKSVVTFGDISKRQPR